VSEKKHFRLHKIAHGRHQSQRKSEKAQKQAPGLVDFAVFPYMNVFRLSFFFLSSSNLPKIQIPIAGSAPCPQTSSAKHWRQSAFSPEEKISQRADAKSEDR